jgi:hypothetical protein
MCLKFWNSISSHSSCHSINTLIIWFFTPFSEFYRATSDKAGEVWKRTLPPNHKIIRDKGGKRRETQQNTDLWHLLFWYWYEGSLLKIQRSKETSAVAVCLMSLERKEKWMFKLTWSSQIGNFFVKVDVFGFCFLWGKRGKEIISFYTARDIRRRVDGRKYAEQNHIPLRFLYKRTSDYCSWRSWYNSKLTLW